MPSQGKTVARGYGVRHRRLRRYWQRLIDSGVPVQCPRCCEWIGPGQKWDLGHVDGTKDEYQGPEHRSCNRATAGRNTIKNSRRW